MKAVLRISFMLTVAMILSFTQLESSFGVTASPSLIKYEQPDGTVIQYRIQGDENTNWKETKDGSIISLDARSGYFRYVNRFLNKIYTSSARVGIDSKPIFSANSTDALELIANSTTSGSMLSIEQNINYTNPISVPSTQKTLVFIINYLNISSTAEEGYWADKFFGSTYPSVNNYYNEVSYGKTSIGPATENYQQVNDGVIEISLPYNHPAEFGYTSSVSSAVASHVRQALEIADEYVDFSAYDQNLDGDISSSELHIAAIFAGGEAATGGVYNSIWAHAWSYPTLALDGKTMNHYIAIGENFGASDGTPSLNKLTIGTICHELGHSMGLPDLYDYGQDSQGVGSHSLMGSGSWGAASYAELVGSSPVHPDAWSKIMLGFVMPTIAAEGSEYNLIQSVSPAYNVLKVAIPNKPYQYFLVENRQFSGYDAGLTRNLKKGGIVIYHVDEEVLEYSATHSSNFSKMNDNRFRKAVDVEEANANIMNFEELDYDGYPGFRSLYINPPPISWNGYHYFAAGDASHYASRFDDTSKPSSRAYTYNVDSTIVPPTIYDSMTGKFWNFETASGIGTQDTQTNISLEVMDSVTTSMRVGYNTDAFSIIVTAFPSNQGVVAGGGRYLKNYSASISATPKSGYVFTSWEEGDSSVSTDNPFVFTVTQDRTLVANFRPIHYTIQFHPNGGTGSMEPISMEYGESKTLPLVSFNRTGYWANGWLLDGSLEDCIEGGGVVSNLTDVDDGIAMLYANWNPISYTIQYYLNEGQNHPENPSQYTIESDEINLKTPTREGFRFEGWYNNSEFNGTPITTIPSESNGTKVFYAKWNPFDHGTGTIEDPYQIQTSFHLNQVRNYLDCHFIQTTDIVFSENDFKIGGNYYNEGIGWRPIADRYDKIFTGSFNGNGHKIVGLQIHKGDSNIGSYGLFSKSSGKIYNIKMESLLYQHPLDQYSNYGNYGGIVGENSGTIENCSASGKMTNLTLVSVGGIASTNTVDGVIKDCSFSGEVNTSFVYGSISIGGIVSENQGNISNCENLANLKAVKSNTGNENYSLRIGGIAAYNQGSVLICNNAGAVYLSGTGTLQAGGIAACNLSMIDTCYNTGNISAHYTANGSEAGGISGINAGEQTKIVNCYNTGNIYSRYSLPSDHFVYMDAGGISGSNAAQIIYCYNVGKVYGGDNTVSGGIVGFAWANNQVANSYYLTGTGFNSLGKACTEINMQTQANYTGFDFQNVWTMDTKLKRPIHKLNPPTIYSIYFAVNSGVMPIGSKYAYMQGSYNLLALPTKTGSTFLGWSRASNLTGTLYTSIPAGTVGNISYYAKWGAPITSAVSYNYTSIKVSWAAAGGATSYRIYRATSATGTYSLVYTASSTARSWIDTGQTTGKYYYYKVYPMVGTKAYANSTYKYAKAIPSTPTATLTKYTSTSIKVAWTGVSGATKYQIYRATSATGTYSLVYTASSTLRSWVNTGRTPGVTYYYKVRAYHLEGSSYVYGAFSAVKYLKI
jgi:M6 family metalloprotease-like protein/uncharacterized repeat protein (TIGR02543 family)